jgi:hypothetical protein
MRRSLGFRSFVSVSNPVEEWGNQTKFVRISGAKQIPPSTEVQNRMSNPVPRTRPVPGYTYVTCYTADEFAFSRTAPGLSTAQPTTGTWLVVGAGSERGQHGAVRAPCRVPGVRSLEAHRCHFGRSFSSTT